MTNTANTAEEEDFVRITEEFIRQKILHVTLVFGPKLSPSMLQVGIGTAIAPRMWHPIIEELIQSRVLNRYTTTLNNPATGRDQSYTIIERRIVKQ